MKYIFFDTETTGLLENSLLPIDRQPHIIELFMLKCDENGKELETFNSMFSVNFKLSPEIIRITGIKDEDLVGKPRFFEKVKQVDEFIKDADAIVAHNLKYDLSLMDLEFKRSGIGEFETKGKRLICTVEQTEYLKGYRLNLTSLHELLFGEPFSGAHRAEEDVRALARCFYELKNKEMI